MDEKQYAHHLKVKRRMKIIGVSMLVVGAALTAIGTVDFIRASQAMSGMPKLLWCIMLGLPLCGFGGGISAFAFRREISTYVKNESVPVINEMGEEIAPAVKAVAHAARGTDTRDKDASKSPETPAPEVPSEATVRCSCGEINRAGSQFCKKCGKALPRVCPFCGGELDADSTFCNHCGKKIG